MDLRPEHGEERGEERQREHDRERDHDGAPHPHGPEKRAPEEHEPTEPCSHREAREAHDASRAFERTRERLRIVVPGRDLFAVAAQGEERIVDGDAEPDERADVDRVLRDVDDVREPEHHGDPADDGQRAHPDGQRGRDDCPEDEQQDEELDAGSVFIIEPDPNFDFDTESEFEFDPESELDSESEEESDED